MRRGKESTDDEKQAQLEAAHDIVYERRYWLIALAVVLLVGEVVALVALAGFWEKAVTAGVVTVATATVIGIGFAGIDAA